MRDTEHMKNHLFVVTRVNGKLIRRQPIEDPFLTNKTMHVQEWSLWDWLKMIFTRRYEVEVITRVESDGVSQGRWFQGADICEKCRHNRIDTPGQHPTKPGYESHGMRVCQECYYGTWAPPVANVSDCKASAE